MLRLQIAINDNRVAMSIVYIQSVVVSNVHSGKTPDIYKQTQ